MLRKHICFILKYNYLKVFRFSFPIKVISENLNAELSKIICISKLIITDRPIAS